jgi:betaine reductase
MAQDPVGQARVRVLHYLNQFFGQLGGEAAAGEPPLVRPGPVGPGALLQQRLGGRGEVVATLICGDGFFAEREGEALSFVRRVLSDVRPRLVVAGPAFGSGRYGLACGAVGAAAAEAGAAAVAGLSPDNPAVALYRRRVIVVPTAATAAGMAQAVDRMVEVGLRAAAGRLGTAEEEGYLPRGLRLNRRDPRSGAERAVALLLDRLEGRAFRSEVPPPDRPAGRAAPPVADLARARLGLVVEGGLVPRGNPDRLLSARGLTWGSYPLPDALRPEAWEVVSGGFDPGLAREDPNRLLPLDALRAAVADGSIGELAPAFHTLVGNAVSPQTCERWGGEILAALRAQRVDAVLLTST